MNTVRRAIIMAAGEGKRMRPLTNTIPKPLIKVNGTRMIDTIVNGLIENGITEIYVVIGHLKEHFFVWAENHPEVSLIENPYYDKCNNISSLYVAREHLGDCMILDGDQIICNPAILDPQFDLSGYNAVWSEKETSEWLMTVEDGIVSGCSRTGGSHGWQLFSVSRWNKEDSKKLKYHLESEFMNGNRNIYWDDIVMFCHFDEYTLGITEMNASDLIEIDDLHELASVDHDYQYLLNADENLNTGR